ncbi:MAG: NAD(P)-binding domain-containing protein [Bacilli bacterium]|nr:NAD(P)-binding domain-containing protein [Bacilli bacterium]
MKIGIIGSGAYAIALSTIFENVTDHIMMWTKIEQEYQELTNNHTNKKALDFKLNSKITFTMSLEELLNKNEIIVLAIPAKFVKTTIDELKPFYNNQKILIATKGMIDNPNYLIHDYLSETLKTNNISCISGPSFAIDLIKKEPIGLTLASLNQNNLDLFKNIFKDINYITLDYTNDLVGVEVCSILKNIVAIASGILKGMNINNSTIAKFLKDASLEIQSIIEKLNGQKDTFLNYAGIGDFILTATNSQSRNYTFGTLIGEDKDYKTYMENTTVEGLENLNSMYNYLKTKEINSNIISLLYNIIYLNLDKNTLIHYLKNEQSL